MPTTLTLQLDSVASIEGLRYIYVWELYCKLNDTIFYSSYYYHYYY